MLDVDPNLFSSLDLKQDQVTQDFQFDPPVTATPLTKNLFFKDFTWMNPHCEILSQVFQMILRLPLLL